MAALRRTEEPSVVPALAEVAAGAAKFLFMVSLQGPRNLPAGAVTPLDLPPW